MEKIREAAVAGSFYPADPIELKNLLDTLLPVVSDNSAPPKAMILPHAGYIYSGPVAATGDARLSGSAGKISRVILLGPTHRKAIRGLALPDATAFRTPLGTISLDTGVLQQLRQLPQVSIDDAAHRLEHSLEVHLPFLQHTLKDFSLVPILVGDATNCNYRQFHIRPCQPQDIDVDRLRLRLGIRGKKAPEGNIIRTLILCLHRSIHITIAGHADNFCRAKSDASLLQRLVIPPQMHTIGIHTLRQLHIIID
mgnify:CR=1 FL=1